MSYYKMLTVLVLTVFVSIYGSYVYAHSGAEGIVKERMMKMKTIGKAMKSMAVMIRNKTSFDPDKARIHALTIKNHSGKALTDLFPEGSLQQPTEAKPEIWSEWQEFEEPADQLTLSADVLEVALDKDHKKRAVAFAKVGKTCSNCHKSFRKKK